MFETGLVESPTCIQVQREVLVGVAIGSTAQRTKEMVEKARGATLFVDEAYRLALSTQNDFGPEAVETIMSVIEGGPQTTSNRPAFIFAGYPALMERFISTNPGLKRRWPIASTSQIILAKKSLSSSRRCVTRQDRQWEILILNWLQSRGRIMLTWAARMLA